MKKNKKALNKQEKLILIFEQYLQQDTSDEIEHIEIDFFIDIVAVFRPINLTLVTLVSLQPLIEIIHTNETYYTFFKTSLQKVLHRKDFDTIITDTGIIKDSDFIYEVKKRLIGKLIPFQPPKETLQFLLNQVFYASTDPIWLKKIPVEELLTLIEISDIQPFYFKTKENFEIAEIVYSIEVLAQRITGKALESNVNKMVPEYRNLDSPFIAFNKEITALNSRIIHSDAKFVKEDDLDYKQICILLAQCENFIEVAYQNAKSFGINLKVNQSLLRIRQQLNRVKEMLPFLVLQNEAEAGRQSILLSLQLIIYNCGRTNITKLINDSTQSIAYEITNHTAKTGENYITSSSKEYFKMFWDAFGGGLIVGFLCIFKILLGKVETSGFGHAFLYSMNYSIGFIAIYLFHFTLATKQPAMTASALANALYKGKEHGSKATKEQYIAFAQFFARVFRSQFIAFVGNVIAAFPVALLLIWAIYQFSDYDIAANKWPTLLNDLNPITSNAILHAAIAGFFLFISGIIAGYIANRDKYEHVYYRIQEHPILKKTLGKDKAKKLSKLYEKKWAGIISNCWFGIFLGSTFSIGVFLGLDLDIRHITFAAGNFAMGLFGASFNLPTAPIIWGIIGIGVIGLINFIVSFSLSLSVALRSRNIPFKDLGLISLAVWQHFKANPLSFFFPKKSKKNTEEFTHE